MSNILIVGNGFDLAHGLPTSCSHFIHAIDKITEMPYDLNKVSFDHIYGDIIESQSEFF